MSLKHNSLFLYIPAARHKQTCLPREAAKKVVLDIVEVRQTKFCHKFHKHLKRNLEEL